MALTQWLAHKASLPYFHIDPLKVDFTRVAEVMSSSYATTYSILPVAVSSEEVTIATCEPFQTGWEREIEQITKKSVRRVVSNPLDIARYTTEFYKLAQQVKGAAKAGATPLVSSFEQLVELGGKVQADDAHVIHIVDWLLQYAFDQRASDIHLEPRREQGVARFRIDGVLHHVYQVPAGVMAAMTSRLKLLGRMDVVEKSPPQDGRIKTKVVALRPAAPAAAAAPRASDDGLDAERAKAERLARIVVSDIVLYNEQRFAAAARSGNVLDAMSGDLAEGRQLFEERIDARVRAERDHLKEELLRRAQGQGTR